MAYTKNNRNTSLSAINRLVPINIAISTSVKEYGINIIAINTSNTLLVGYEYRVGTSWATSVLIANTNSSSHTWTVQSAGIYTIWCAAIDIYGYYSVPANTVVVIAAPGYSSISGVVEGPNIKLDWTISASAFAIDSYEIRYGAAWGTATYVGSSKATTYTVRVAYLGPLTWWVAAKDIAGNFSTPTAVNIPINSPSKVLNIIADIIDNNVLLYWGAPVVGYGQVPIDQYEVRKGATWETGTLIGSNANSTFTSIFEQAAGEYSYWIAAIDTAGNYGEAVKLSAKVNQPPDYVLRNNYNSTLLGTKVNFYLDNGGLVGPVITSQLWSTHFSGNNWNTPADQVTAGYPIYATPGVTSGSYEEILDYGTNILSTIATSNITISNITGTVTNVCTLSWKLNIGDPWTVMSTGSNVVLLPVFRYLRVQYAFSCTGLNNLVRISSLNIKLDIKQRSDSGNAVAVVGGTQVNFGYPFIYVDTPIVQPSSTTTPLVPVVNYVGTVNPTNFTVRIFNLSGVEVGGAFSWAVKGY